MEIDVTFDQNQANLPTGFVDAVNYVANYFDSVFTNNVTFNIDVGYGEIDGQSLGAGDLGESLPSANNQADSFYTTSYSSVRSALIAQGAPGSSILPSTAPLSGTVTVTAAEAKALGIITTNPGVDGYVGFDSGSNVFSYGINTTPPSTQYYFVGVVEHEFTEVMGRISRVNDEPHHYTPMDLYRYSSPGTPDQTTGGAGSTAYFSIDNGTTNLGSWNNDARNGDLGDWYPSGPAPAGDDAFNDYNSPGVINQLSSSDLTLMQAIGWLGSPTPTPTPTPTPVPSGRNNYASFSRLFTTGSGTTNYHGTSDRIVATAGAERLNLLGSNDTIGAGFEPGMSTDRIDLGSNNVFSAGPGSFADTVVGFDQASGDRIHLTNESIHQVVAYSSWLVDGGKDAKIALADGSTIILKGITDLTGSFFS